MLLYNFEGPKGSGKSTLSGKLSAEYASKLGKPVEVRHFDSYQIVSNKDLDDTKNDYYNLIFDRGLLSYQLYDWLWNNGLSENINRDYLGLSLSVKQPVNRHHFDTLMSLVEHKYIILYSSDFNILVDRINHRHSVNGKGMNELEKSTLKDSNAYFKYLGEFLKYLYPDKVLLIDIANNQSVDELIDYILQSGGSDE